MRITFVCRGMGEGGGIQRVIDELIPEIVKNPSVKELILVSDNFDKKLEQYKKVKLIKIWTPAIFLKKLPKYWLALFTQPIFIIISSIWLAIKHKELGVIFNHGGGQTLYQNIVVFHSCHHEWVEVKKKKNKFRAYFSPLDWLILVCEKINMLKFRESKIVAVSNFTKEQIMKHFKTRDIKVITNGVNTHRFSPSNSAQTRDFLRKKYNLNAKDRLIIFVANEWKRKGLEQLAKATAELKGVNSDIKLIVAGRDLKTATDNLKEKYGLEKELVYLGEVQKIEEVYRLGDIFCLPTEEDAFGLVIGEAMSCALPIIITDRCGIKSYIHNLENGMVVSYNNLENELSSSLKLLLKDEKLRKKIAQNGSETVKNKLSWVSIAEKYIDIAKEVNSK